MFTQSNFTWSTFNCKIFSFSILRPQPLNLVTTIPRSHHCTTCGKKKHSLHLHPRSLTWNLKIISGKKGDYFVVNHHFSGSIFFGGVTFRNPSHLDGTVSDIFAHLTTIEFHSIRIQSIAWSMRIIWICSQNIQLSMSHSFFNSICPSPAPFPPHPKKKQKGNLNLRALKVNIAKESKQNHSR